MKYKGSVFLSQEPGDSLILVYLHVTLPQKTVSLLSFIAYFIEQEQL